MEIIKNLWQVGGGDLTAPEDAAIYLADILCEGHFGVFKGKKKIEKFIRSYMMI